MRFIGEGMIIEGREVYIGKSDFYGKSVWSFKRID